MSSVQATNIGRQCRLCSSAISSGQVCTACRPTFNAWLAIKCDRRADANQIRSARQQGRVAPLWALAWETER